MRSLHSRQARAAAGPLPPRSRLNSQGLAHNYRGCMGPREAPGARRCSSGGAVVHRPAPPLRQCQHGRAAVGQSRGRVDDILAPAWQWPHIGTQLLTRASQRTLYDTCRRHSGARQAGHPARAGHGPAPLAKRAWPLLTGLGRGAQLTGTPGRGSHIRRSGSVRGRAGRTTPHARQGVQPANDSRPGCTADSSLSQLWCTLALLGLWQLTRVTAKRKHVCLHWPCHKALL